MNIQPFNQTGQMIELCCEYLSVLCIWLYVIIMSRTSFRVNPHFLLCLNVKERFAQNRRLIWSLSDSTAFLLWNKGKIRTCFKTLVSKKTAKWRLTKSWGNHKFLEKNNVFHLSHRIKNIHRSKLHLITNIVEKKMSPLRSVRVFFVSIEKRKPNKYCLCEWSKVNSIHVHI